MYKANLSVIWWNTSLSPPTSKKKKSKGGISKAEKLQASVLVFEQLLEAGYDFICLGEISSEDIEYLSEKLNLVSSDYTFIDGYQIVGKLHFDTCIIFKKIHNLISDPTPFKNLIYSIGGRQSKVAQRYEFNFSPLGETIVLYLSHWSGQQSTDDKLYGNIAQDLRSAVNSDLIKRTPVILLGDYNVEPHHQSMVFNLQSSREKELVLYRKDLFYNPCWRFLSSTQNLTSDTNILGSYYLRKTGVFNTWHILDQILVSKHFLSNKWNFQDRLVEIIDMNAMFDSPISDHMAISMLIERAVK